ncbi:hypothetical protein [Pedobacter sp. SL55]|uniref:hypothetical protein n=1 Tax=Pedobacter sp. SL55 TaxID=2995161 RepID=UPI00227197EA|nr:hypothetical protein [Pedobacter sp. SL55]WAC40374.1 hypothetical protein OVA16_17645 [Pedobacter sp. SL55]
MINLLNSWMPINCPACNFSFEVMLRDIRLEEICYCHNCKKSIKLIDNNASFHTEINQANEALKSLEIAIKKMFK